YDLRIWNPLLYRLSYWPSFSRPTTWTRGAPCVACSAGSTFSAPAAAAAASTSSSCSCARRTRRRRARRAAFRPLLGDLRDDAGADRATALADREALLLFQRDRRDELDGHRDVVARHDHLHVLRQLDAAGDVRRPHVELRAVAVEERLVTA